MEFGYTVFHSAAVLKPGDKGQVAHRVWHMTHRFPGWALNKKKINQRNIITVLCALFELISDHSDVKGIVASCADKVWRKREKRKEFLCFCDS